ncbi:hypothetical protein [Paraliomyxa miuraensis]|uniref:hypothetical protein n=1 Tax=Paraliomyxa miuraensis TaxID=376150 RepID=UPI002255DDFE|nr:hypothetical protein [Paraliomyxa miuraensis]MCX4241310.1 hypothetical protein [Paraliomyxa miuraensis]
MADDRTLAPGPARWRRAWAAGLRPRAQWLWPAAAGLLLAAGLDGVHEAGPSSLGLDVRPGAIAPTAWLEAAAGWLAGCLGLAGLLVVLVTALARRLGWVSTVARRRLGATPRRPSSIARLLLVGVVGVGLVLALAGVVAGSARAIDASEASLGALWLGWARRGTVTVALVLLGGAVVELWLDRRERAASLRQTPQQRRDEARMAGAR